MNNAERFMFLMRVIDNWIEKEPDRYAGPLRCLREEIWIRRISVTPGCSINVAQLKTFLATKVLEIYPWNTNSKISYRDIQRSLSGETTKKYSFYYGELERCFSPEENRKAAEKNILSCADTPLTEDVDEGKIIPIFLLEKIQKMVRINLGEYWSMCDLDYKKSQVKYGERIKWKQKEDAQSDEEETLIKKQNKYMECLMTVALHEIFVRECEWAYQELFWGAEYRGKRLRQIKEEMAVFVEHYAATDENEKKILLEKGECWKREIDEYTKWFVRYAAFLPLCLEHTVGIEAEIQLVMILETKNLEMMKKDASLGFQLMKYLDCLKDKNTESFVRYNKNRSKYYRQLEADMNDIFIHYMERVPIAKQRNISRAVETYLRIVGRGRQSEEELQELWEAQCIMVMPFWGNIEGR